MSKGNKLILMGIASILCGALLIDYSYADVTGVLTIFIGIGCVVRGTVSILNKWK